MSEEVDQHQLEGSTYDVIRKRLEEQGKGLLDSANKLNARRQEVFGGSETTLINTTRARTEHNCVPRDIIRFNKDRLLLGYSVVMGLKNETAIEDVFAKLEFHDDEFKSMELVDLKDPGFKRDFEEIFQYYKTARLLQLRRTDTHILMVFQTGQKLSDTKVLRWAIQGEKIVYQDNRGERDHVFPSAQDFKWTRTTRENHSYGSHPHVNIDDEIFVECIGGDLTIKIENNTESGSGIFAEDVEEGSQGLDDAEILFANLESAIVLKIRPYRENDYRYIVYNKQTKEAVRIDAIGSSCQQLPEGHGLIFPNGFYLSNGVFKVFPHNIDNMEFIRSVRSPNGEDSAYVYYDRKQGSYVILQYNLIMREVSTPQICNGYTIGEDGKLILFRADDEPSRVHTMQIWQTPFCSEEYAARNPVGGDTFLGTIGNKDLVRGISDILHINRMISNQSPNMQVYEDLLRRIGHVLDVNHWLGHEEAFGLETQLRAIKKTADGVIDEFDKVQQLKEQADKQLSTLQAECKTLLRSIALDGQHVIDDYVKALSGLRAKRGQINTARDVRYVDVAALDELEKSAIDNIDRLSQGAVDFLLQEDSLETYTNELQALDEQSEAIETVVEAKPIAERIDELSAGLDMLMEIVNGLDIADSTDRTAILERISEVYGSVNRVRAVLEGNRKELSQREGRAEFGVQFKILAQTASNYLGLCDSPEKTDEFLAKLMIQVEEMEAQYVDFDDFLDDLTTKREEIYESFSQRKQSLLDDRQRRADGLTRSAERILSSVKKRAVGFADMDELNAYFASDNMVQKARALIKDLTDLGDTVRADDLAGQVKAAREDAIRHIRDKTELFDDDNLIKFGRHKFSVNTQALDLTMLPREDDMYFHLTGTDYFQIIDDESFQATRRFWNQDVASENNNVYRAEYLAWQIIDAAERGADDLSIKKLHEIILDEDDLKNCIRGFASQRYEEAYERGLHDIDAAKIVSGLMHLRESNGLLRFAPSARALVVLYWQHLPEDEQERLQARCRSLFTARGSLGALSAFAQLHEALRPRLESFAQDIQWPCGKSVISQALHYLGEELGRQDSVKWSCSGASKDLIEHFFAHLDMVKQREIFDRELKRVRGDILASLDMIKVWLSAYVLQHADEAEHVLNETVVFLYYDDEIACESIHAQTIKVIDGLLGQHPRIQSKQLELRLDEFNDRLNEFALVEVPAYKAFQELRKQIIEDERHKLRLEEFKPRVLTSFVRNRLINEVYMPMIGDNLAKQCGSVGDGKRTDLMGMLLLISPPGYGKTTLMEYVSSVLGLTFMKINGPAIGHEVTSLDPAEAPNVTARQELEKLNLSFEMGNNVMIYLDDIQHCNPELLQKFISLCDGQRKIEGVWKGRSRTYDLRGKKVAVVMAGNPYTESGDKFQIPDMLANRADTYNLGDILGGAQEAFELSYLENCLTTNAILAPVATRSQQDFYRLIRIAEGDDASRSELEHPYSALELEDMCKVIRHLRTIQSAILKVNMAYIESASMSDDFRVEPAFKLQGSYRNMAKLAEKIVPVMNDEELLQILVDHYVSESQTLTTGAEANLLKFRHMLGIETDEERQRWKDICKTYARNQELVGGEDDPMANALLQLIKINEGLGGVESAIQGNAAKKDLAEQLAPLLERLLARPEQAEEKNSEEQKIEIINTLPRYYGKLYETHIRVIEQSLIPTMDAVGKYLDTSYEFRKGLYDVVEYLKKLLGEHNVAHNIDTSTDDDEVGLTDNS